MEDRTSEGKGKGQRMGDSITCLSQYVVVPNQKLDFPKALKLNSAFQSLLIVEPCLLAIMACIVASTSYANYYNLSFDSTS